MRDLTKLSLGLAFVSALAFAGCSGSDDNAGLHVISGGGSTQTAAGSGAGGASTLGGTGPTGGITGSSGSSTGGTGGDSAALGGGSGLGGSAGISSAGTSGTSATAGTGGSFQLIPAVVLFDSILIHPKSQGAGNGAGGQGGADGQSAAAGSPAQGGAAGSTDATGSAGAVGAVGAAGAPSTVDFSRSYTFDTTLQLWALHAEGSTPNIGLAGGGEKLSARSTLSVNSTEGQPTPGSMQISIPFSMTAEQLDVNQLFAAAGMEENWTGYEMIAKVKLLSSGNLPDCLGTWLYATSTGYVFGRGAEVLLKPADGWVDVRFDLDAPDVAGSKANFDKTMINQFGVMVETNHCP
ncbi:MAG TPA: hypothetical protein VNW92_12865 [Polyangiaceae bacterium]|jgi:hypothetical protein|nr:hypothetical protein [Polyangiaceae bacterium]